MADWLVLRLPREPLAQASWMVADAGGRAVIQPETGALEQAAALSSGRRVCVLAPGADVLRIDAQLPVKAGAKLQQVVPYALEEQLAEDIDELHFAIGKTCADTRRTPVAVVARTLMDQWLATLRAARLEPDALYADTDLLPQNPGHAVALLEGDLIIVRPVGEAPVTMPVEALAQALSLALPDKDEISAEPGKRGLILYTGAMEWHRHGREVEALRERFEGIQVQLLSGGPLPLFAQQLPSSAPINLLQGSYATRSSSEGTWRRWRTAAALLVGLIVLHVGGKAAELVMLKRTERQLDQSIAEIFRQAMPGAESAIDARRRLEQRLLSTQPGAGSGLLPALAAVAEARSNAPGTVVQALSFRSGAIELKLAAPDANTLDRLSQSLRGGGWQADLTSATVARSGYEGRIQMKPPGAS